METYKHWILLLWIFLAASFAVGQECTTYVVVDPFDKGTHAGIQGLKAEDFEAKVGGASMQVVSSNESFNSRVLVIVQGAGSAEDSNIATMARLVAEKARQVPADRSVAFGAFGNRAVFTKGFLGSSKERDAGIDEVMSQLNSLGKDPALFDALHEGIALFGQPQPGDAIVLVGIGHDIKSKRNDRDLEREFSEHQIRLLATVFRKSSVEGLHANREAKYEEVFALHRLASSTGGAYTHGFSPGVIDFAWNGYLLGISLPANLDKPKSWKLQLHGPAAKAHKDALIFQPSALAPCNNAVATAH